MYVSIPEINGLLFLYNIHKIYKDLNEWFQSTVNVFVLGFVVQFNREITVLTNVLVLKLNMYFSVVECTDSGKLGKRKVIK